MENNAFFDNLSRPGKMPGRLRLLTKYFASSLLPISYVLYSFKRRRFRACGRDQGAFRSPPGLLRPPCLMKRLHVKERKNDFLSVPWKKTLFQQSGPVGQNARPAFLIFPVPPSAADRVSRYSGRPSGGSQWWTPPPLRPGPTARPGAGPPWPGCRRR